MKGINKMNWPLYSGSQAQLVLECPICRNRLKFKALPVKDQLIWSCESCKNSASLRLVPLHTDNRPISNVNGFTQYEIN
jgi:hypothetical protein